MTMTKSSSVVDFPKYVAGLEAARQTSVKQEIPKAMPKALKATQVLEESTLRTERLNKLSPRLKELVTMLEYARPEGTSTEEVFIAKYLDTLPGMTKDQFGNRICRVGKEEPTIAWSSHTDTVHYTEGIQAIEIDKHGLIGLDTLSEANCLGADCTVGVWLMRRLILAGKPGLYIFHRSEESGGIGSKWIARNTPELVSNIKAMIALDRRGYTSVITEQSTGKTASDRFALSLADQLNKLSGFDGNFKPDDGGIFTDSAFYSHLIPECTNISVGYFSQHSSKETLDYVFADDLLLALLKLDYSKLEIARDPEADTTAPWDYDKYYYSRRDYWNYSGHAYEHDSYAKHLQEQWEAPAAAKDYELVELISRNPEAVARLFGYWDLTADDLYEAIRDYDEAQREENNS